MTETEKQIVKEISETAKKLSERDKEKMLCFAQGILYASKLNYDKR